MLMWGCRWERGPWHILIWGQRPKGLLPQPCFLWHHVHIRLTVTCTQVYFSPQYNHQPFLQGGTLILPQGPPLPVLGVAHVRRGKGADLDIPGLPKGTTLKWRYNWCSNSLSLSRLSSGSVCVVLLRRTALLAQSAAECWFP